MKCEEERVREIMEEVMRDNADGDDVSKKLVYDERSRTIRPASESQDDDNCRSIVVRLEDMNLD